MNAIPQVPVTFQNTRILASAVYEATGIIATTAQLIKFVVLGIFAIISDLADLVKRAIVRKVSARKVEDMTFEQRLNQVVNSAISKVKQTAKSAQNFVKNNPKIIVQTIAVSALLIGVAYAYNSYSPISNLNIPTPKKPLSEDVKEFFVEEQISSLPFEKYLLTIGVVAISIITTYALFLYNKKKRRALELRESVAEKLASPEYPNLSLIADLADGLENLDERTKNWVKKHAKDDLTASGYKSHLAKEPSIVVEDIDRFYLIDFEKNQLDANGYEQIKEIVKIIEEDNTLGSLKLLGVLNKALSDPSKYNNLFYIWHEIALSGAVDDLKRIKRLTKEETSDKDFDLLEKVKQSIENDSCCLGNKRNTALGCLETILNNNENTRFNYLKIIYKYLEDNGIYEEIHSLCVAQLDC